MTELYNSLFERCTSAVDYSSDQLRDIATKINSFDTQAAEMAFVLIRIYSLRHGQEPFQLPYEGKAENKSIDGSSELYDMVFNLERFPSDLTCLLDTFVKTVDGSKVERTGPSRSRSPRGKNEGASAKSFMKKTIKPLPVISLRQIDFANLDKTFAMTEIIKYGEQSLLSHSDSGDVTNVLDIGIKPDSQQHRHKLVIRAPDVESEEEMQEDAEYSSLSLYSRRSGSRSGRSKSRSKSPKRSYPHSFRRTTDRSPKQSRKEKTRKRRELNRKKREDNHICDTCFYCSLVTPLDWEVLQIYDGYFCSFHCARSYGIENRLPNEPLQLLFKRYFPEKTSSSSIISPAPDRRLLEKFGGSLTEDEYRDLFHSDIIIYFINQSISTPMCVTSDIAEGYASYRTKNSSSSILYKEAPKLSFDHPEQCSRIYKTN